MIQGFQNETQPLSQYEAETLTPIIARGLSKRMGKHNCITNREIVSAMKSSGYKLDSARLRKIINHIRVTGMVKCLVATSDGYYVATTKDDLASYVESLIGRENAIHSVRNALEQQMALL